MADVIRIKRRASPGSPGAPTTLQNAELAYNENDHILYIGEGTGGGGGSATVIVPIGGTGLASLASPVFTGDPRAPTPTTADNDTSIATTAFVKAQGYLIANQTITLSGDVTGSGTAGIVATLATVNSNVGTFQGLTVNGKGLVTGAVNMSYAPLASPTFTGTVTAPSLVLTAQATDLALNGHKITGLADPIAASDAATKQYADNLVQGLDAKQSVRCATTAPITLSGAQTIDGISVVANDRVLVKDQAAPATNGIYVVSAGAWTRAGDMDIWAEVPSGYAFVEAGTVNADTGWVCTADLAGGTLGTTPINFALFSNTGTITAGAGLTRTGNTIDVVGTAARILVNADNIDIDAGYVGQASITTLGSIATGTWNGTTIAVNRGGTGVGTLTGYVKGAGTAPLTGVATIPNTDITGLGTMSTQNFTAVAITGGTIDGVTLDGGTF